MIVSLPEEEAAEITKELLRKKYRSSLYLTAKHLLGNQDIEWKTHGPMIKILESQGKRKLICVPRGTLKSTVCSIAYPIWLLINNPNLRILLDSAKLENAQSFLREIKFHLKSQKFIDLFGDLRGEIWTVSEIVVKTRTEAKKEVSIACAGVDVSKVSQHFDVIIHDDLNNDKNSATIELRRKVLHHYQMNTSILEPDGTMLIVGTRYAADDVIGWVLENEVENERKAE